jgi:hypothetical protein
MMMMMIAGRVERGTEAHGAPFHVPANLAVVQVVSGAVSVICDCVLFAYTFRRASALTVVCSVDVRRVPQRVGRGVRSITLHSVPYFEFVGMYPFSFRAGR